MSLSNPKVLVLMSTYNGGDYLTYQLDSLLRQQDVHLRILVRDDGSNDNTKEILCKYAETGFLEWYSGKNIGPAKSFMDLIFKSSDADFYAFCDQDDIWDDDKLKQAINFLLEADKSEPSIYFSNTQLVNNDLSPIKSYPIKYLFTFGESLLRNPATGCTVVFNSTLRNHLCSYKPSYVSMHDSWAYRVCLAIGGRIFFDEIPHIKYRQHKNNVLGGKKGFLKTWKRRYKSFKKSKENTRLLTVQNLLSGYSTLINPENKKLLENLSNYRKSFRNKLSLFFCSKIKTASIEGRLAFIFSILFNRY